MTALDTLSPPARATLFEVLVRLSGAHGAPGADERRALAGARRALGLTSETYEPPSPLSEVSPQEARLIYCAAVWMSLADGLTVREESRALEALADELRLDGETAGFLARQARWVRTSTGDLPPHHELALLLSEVSRRMRVIAQRRRAAA